MKGKRVVIFVVSCFCVSVAAMLIAMQIESTSTLFKVLDIVQALFIIFGLWDLVIYMARKSKDKNILFLLSDAICYLFTPANMRHAAVYLRENQKEKKEEEETEK